MKYDQSVQKKVIKTNAEPSQFITETIPNRDNCYDNDTGTSGRDTDLQGKLPAAGLRQVAAALRV